MEAVKDNPRENWLDVEDEICPEAELEEILIFGRILIFGTVQDCTVLNITKCFRILAR